MTDIETSLRRSYADCHPPVPDAFALVEGARRRGNVLRRRRQVTLAAVAAIAVVTAVLGGRVLTASTTGHSAPVSAAKEPTAAGPELTVYRYTTSSGPTRIVSFIDTRGRWCLKVEQSTGASDSYQCVNGDLPQGRSGFGRVATRTDAFGYDGINQWLQGIATHDVAKVEVVLSNGSTRTGHVVVDATGVVFSVRVPWLATPVFYQAYDARGRLLEQLRVPRSLPNDPFADWRPFAG